MEQRGAGSDRPQEQSDEGRKRTSTTPTRAHTTDGAKQVTERGAGRRQRDAGAGATRAPRPRLRDDRAAWYRPRIDLGSTSDRDRLDIGSRSILRARNAGACAFRPRVRGGSSVFIGLSLDLCMLFVGKRVPYLLIRRLSLGIVQNTPSNRSRISSSERPRVRSGAMYRKRYKRGSSPS